MCVPDPRGGCVRPYHNPADRNYGGPHALLNAKRDIDSGAMDGFVRSAVAGTLGCTDRNDPYCVRHGGGIDVMGYHDSREIPNYWAYAHRFVLQDHMFEPIRSWSLPAHLFAVSEWSAICSRKGDPMSCVDAPNQPAEPPDFKGDIRQTDPELRVDGSHVSAAQARCELALLRLQGRATRLRRRRGDDLRAGRAEREDARHLEPAAVLHHGARRPPTRQHHRAP